MNLAELLLDLKDLLKDHPGNRVRILKLLDASSLIRWVVRPARARETSSL